MTNKTIYLTRDFNPRPFGRYREDGERSAQVFREDFLVPAIRAHDRVTVDLSGTNYYGSSFLEETFGGLVRDGFKMEVLEKKLVIVHGKLPSIVNEAWQYIVEQAQSPPRNAA